MLIIVGSHSPDGPHAFFWHRARPVTDPVTTQPIAALQSSSHRLRVHHRFSICSVHCSIL